MKNTLFVVFRCFFVGILLFPVTLLSGLSYASDVVMLYDSVVVCKGSTFSLKRFLDNQVVVPVDCQLLGWNEDVPDDVVVESDMLFHLMYQCGDSPEVETLPFRIRVRDRPKIRLDQSEMRLCKYDVYPPLQYDVFEADQSYFQRLSDGERRGSLPEFGPALNEGEERFLVVATNDQCAESVQEELLVKVVDPRLFSLSVALPPTQYSICDDSVWLCDYLDVHKAQLSYNGRRERTLYEEDLSVSVEWMTDDSFTKCDSMVRESYRNDYHIRVTTQTDGCRSEVVFEESNPQEFYCTGKKITDYALSYSCASEKGVIYWGASLPVVRIRFIPLSDVEAAEPEVFMDDSYNMDTYQFVSKGSAAFCWMTEGKVSYRVEMLCRTEEGSLLTVTDTIEVEPCLRNPPLAVFSCVGETAQVTLASMGRIADVQFHAEQPLGCRRTEVDRAHIPAYYPYVWSYSLNEELSEKESFTCEVTLLSEDCALDTVQSVMTIDVRGCKSAPRLYYGAYRSPLAILQYKEGCRSHQCSNERGVTPAMVEFKSQCYGDTVFLKLKGESMKLKESYRLSIRSEYDFHVISPEVYEKMGQNEFLFYNVSTVNPVVSFVPTEDCEVSGFLEDIEFSYRISVVEKSVQSEYHVCSGDTLDLNDFLPEGERGLLWNVQTTQIVPTHDEVYYLYGFTSNGCLLDERVRLVVDYPLWYQTSEELFCEGERVAPEQLLHSNAQRVVWRDESNVPLDVSDGIYLKGDDSFSVEMYTGCDSSMHTFRVRERLCADEEDQKRSELSEEFVVPAYFTPDGDGVSDRWQVNLPLSKGSWRCLLFDRFGRELARYENEEVSWDGTYHGHRMPSTDYWYVIYRDEELLKIGHFTLR